MRQVFSIQDRGKLDALHAVSRAFAVMKKNIRQRRFFRRRMCGPLRVRGEPAAVIFCNGQAGAIVFDHFSISLELVEFQDTKHTSQRTVDERVLTFRIKMITFKTLLSSLAVTPLALGSIGAAAAGTLTTAAQALEVIHSQDHHFAEPHVVKVADNVYTAVGFHGATTSMIVGADGVIMIDSLMGPKSAENAIQALRKVSGVTLPVKAIIYTHAHGDHTGGAAAYLKYASDEDSVQIIGPEGMGDESGGNSDIRPLLMKRDQFQFGRGLPADQLTNRGIAPANTYDKDRAKGHLKPTVWVDGVLETTIAGISLRLEQASGETPEAMFVWLPKERVLFSGDNFYQAFPNLYAIRGTPYRDVRVWAASDRRMAELKPAALVPGHTSPILGEKQATGALLDYARAIESVYEQTVEGMNRMQDPVTIARNVRLPEDLVGKPWLKEVYGTVENASRSIYSGLVGWYDGNPMNLHPLSKDERAVRLVKLIGGVQKTQQAVEAAVKAADWQWVLELVDLIESHPDFSAQDRKEIRAFRIQALRAIGETESNPLNRNYYFGYSNYLEKTN